MRMSFSYHYFTFIMFTISINSLVMRCQDVKCNSTDLRALITFSNCSNSVIKGWNISSFNCCSWAGVTCDNSTLLSKRVVGLELQNQRLGGELCESLAGLDQLKILNLSQNFLQGYVPSKLFQLQNLEVLDLSSNDFIGSIPAGTHLPSIQYVDISMNRFNGDIDATLCETSHKIQVLNLANNYFTGEVSTTFASCTSMQHLFLNDNNLRGSFPESLLQLRELRTLNLQRNLFSGTLNYGIGNLSNLVTLDVSSNRFYGVLPDVFGRLPKLEHFSASSNKFTGHLPKSLVNSPSLLTLDLDNNTLSGPISVNCSAMVHLTSLSLGSNIFHGPIPESLSSCKGLRVVNFPHNKLGGEVPYNFKNLQTLTFLSLSNSSLSNLSAALQILQFCGNLTTLVLSHNFQHEQMPGDANLQLRNIEALIIPNCHLKGSLPPWLSNCKKLQLLDLSGNFLTGFIPSWIGNFNYIFYLDLSNNSFTGEIPKSLTELQTLTDKNISQGIAANFPFLRYRKSGSGNTLQYKSIWSFPPTVDLSYNKLTGPIWASFGNLKVLHVLSLKENNLSGIIPEGLSEMSSLESLDLSRNKLTGEIPVSLVKLNFLSNFDVAYNQLYGKIPTGGQFMTFPYSSFEGNKDLCGVTFVPCQHTETTDEFPTNPIDKSYKEHLKILDLPFGLGAATGFVLTVIFCFKFVWIRQEERRR